MKLRTSCKGLLSGSCPLDNAFTGCQLYIFLVTSILARFFCAQQDTCHWLNWHSWMSSLFNMHPCPAALTHFKIAFFDHDIGFTPCHRRDGDLRACGCHIVESNPNTWAVIRLAATHTLKVLGDYSGLCGSWMRLRPPAHMFLFPSTAFTLGIKLANCSWCSE